MFYLKKFDIIFMDLKIPTFKKNFILTMLYSLTWPDWTQKKNIFKWTRISRWLGRENEENMARTRNCCGWPSSVPLT